MRIERDRSDPVCMVHQCQSPLLSFNITKVDVKILSPTDDGTAVGSELKAANAATVVRKHLAFLFLGGAVEDSHCAIDVTRGHQRP